MTQQKNGQKTRRALDRTGNTSGQFVCPRGPTSLTRRKCGAQTPREETTRRNPCTHRCERFSDRAGPDLGGLEQQDARSAAEAALGQPHGPWPGVVLQSQSLPCAPNPSQGPRIHTGAPRSAEARPQPKGQLRVLGSEAEPHVCISQAGSSAEAGHLSLQRTEQWEGGRRAEGGPAPGPGDCLALQTVTTLHLGLQQAFCTCIKFHN